MDSENRVNSENGSIWHFHALLFSQLSFCVANVINMGVVSLLRENVIKNRVNPFRSMEIIEKDSEMVNFKIISQKKCFGKQQKNN